MGPGFRVPSTIISAYSRGGRTFTEKCDHVSYILFMEKWAKETLGKDIFSHEITNWRREHMCDYTDVCSVYRCSDVISTDLCPLNRLSALTSPTFRSPSFQMRNSLPSTMPQDCLMA
jgi:phospholipase C